MRLLGLAREGDEGAWAEIFAELAPAVLGYLRANGAPDPDDVLSEAFLQVARDIASFEGEWADFRGWVFTIAHHRLIDARRHAARRPVELTPEPPEPPGTPTTPRIRPWPASARTRSSESSSCSRRISGPCCCSA